MAKFGEVPCYKVTKFKIVLLNVKQSKRVTQERVKSFVIRDMKKESSKLKSLSSLYRPDNALPKQIFLPQKILPKLLEIQVENSGVQALKDSRLEEIKNSGNKTTYAFA